MTQGNKQGMRLRQTDNPGKTNFGWILGTVTAMAAFAAMILAFSELTGFRTGDTLPIMLAAGGYLCLMYGLLVRFQRQQWFFPGVLVLMLVLVLAFRQQTVEGFRLFWNQMRNLYTAGTGWVLPQWETQQEESKLCVTLFAIVTACAGAWLACLLAAWAPGLLAVLLPGALLGGMAVFGRDGEMTLLLPVLAAAVLALLYSGWQRKNCLTPVWCSWLFYGIAACLLVLAASLPGVEGWTQQIGAQTRRAVHAHLYETEDTTLPEGDFTDYQQTSGSAGPGLMVTMSNPEAMYLRGFTGCTYEEDTWKPLDTAVLAENQELLYWLNQNYFSPAAQFAAASSGTEQETGTVAVENLGACSRYRYVPFSLTGGTYLQAENLNTDSLLSEGERTYEYTVVGGGAEGIARTLEHLQTSDDVSSLKYRKAESAYRSFVFSHYLQIPEDTKKLLGKYWEEIAAKYGPADNLTSQQAQECALTFLSRCFPEEGTPEEMDLPLSSAAGTSYQYATVAALTLRYYGIPARYAEGYVISEAMAAAAEPGEAMTVDTSSARAWVEVYQDGVGWIPMELTPGFGELIEEAPDESQNQKDKESDGDARKDQETEEEEKPAEEETPVPDPEGGTVVRIARLVLPSLLLLVLLLLMLLLVFRRRRLLKRKARKFHSDSVSEAVAWIFADTALLLEKLGLERGNGTMRTLSTPIAQRFGEAYASAFRDMLLLNDRAMFSSHALTEQQRQTAMQFHGDTLGLIQTNVTWYRRLWMKWVQCLY
ncbi:MAG: transglutaminase family protein [Faecousia sp.]